MINGQIITSCPLIQSHPFTGH